MNQPPPQKKKKKKGGGEGRWLGKDSHKLQNCATVLNNYEQNKSMIVTTTQKTAVHYNHTIQERSIDLKLLLLLLPLLLSLLLIIITTKDRQRRRERVGLMVM